MSFLVGMQPYAGLWTKTQFQRGKGANPGTIGQIVASDGGTREFIAVKFTAGLTHISGNVVTVDGDGVATLGTAGGPALTVGGRAAVLIFGSATATQTMAATAFGWAQIAGKSAVRIAATISAGITNAMLQLSTDGGVTSPAAGSASAALNGIQSLTASTGTGGAGTLIPVLLTYPKFIGIPA